MLSSATPRTHQPVNPLLLSPLTAVAVAKDMGSFGRIVVIRRTGDDGRDQNCTIRVRFEEVSRFHCTVSADADTRKVFLEDTSSNGTFLNGVELGRDDDGNANKAELKHNDVFMIQSRCFRFEYPFEEQIKQQNAEAPVTPGKILSSHPTANNPQHASFPSSAYPQTIRKHAIENVDQDTPKRRKLSSSFSLTHSASGSAQDGDSQQHPKCSMKLSDKLIASIKQSPPRSAISKRLMSMGTPLRVSTLPVDTSSPTPSQPATPTHASQPLSSSATPIIVEEAPVEDEVMDWENAQDEDTQTDADENPFLEPDNDNTPMTESTTEQQQSENRHETDEAPVELVIAMPKTPIHPRTAGSATGAQRQPELAATPSEAEPFKMPDTPRPTQPLQHGKSVTPHPRHERPQRAVSAGSKSLPRYLGATESSRARQLFNPAGVGRVSVAVGGGGRSAGGLRTVWGQSVVTASIVLPKTSAGSGVEKVERQEEQQDEGLVVEDSQPLDGAEVDVVANEEDVCDAVQEKSEQVADTVEAKDEVVDSAEELLSMEHEEQQAASNVGECLDLVADSTPEPTAVSGEVEAIEKIACSADDGIKAPDNEFTKDTVAAERLESAKKKVRFGRRLSPEIFHKDKPASTPHKRGERRESRDASGNSTTPGGSILKSALRQTLHHTSASPSKVTKCSTSGSGLTINQAYLKPATSKLKTTFCTPSYHTRSGLPMTTSKIPASSSLFTPVARGGASTSGAMTVSPKNPLRDSFRYVPPVLTATGKEGLSNFYGTSNASAPANAEVAETPIKSSDTVTPTVTCTTPFEVVITATPVPVAHSTTAVESPSRTSARKLSIARAPGSVIKGTPQQTPAAIGAKRRSSIAPDTPLGAFTDVRDSLAEGGTVSLLREAESHSIAGGSAVAAIIEVEETEQTDDVMEVEQAALAEEMQLDDHVESVEDSVEPMDGTQEAEPVVTETEEDEDEKEEEIQLVTVDVSMDDEINSVEDVENGTMVSLAQVEPSGFDSGDEDSSVDQEKEAQDKVVDASPAIENIVTIVDDSQHELKAPPADEPESLTQDVVVQPVFVSQDRAENGDDSDDSDEFEYEEVEVEGSFEATDDVIVVPSELVDVSAEAPAVEVKDGSVESVAEAIDNSTPMMDIEAVEESQQIEETREPEIVASFETAGEKPGALDDVVVADGMDIEMDTEEVIGELCELVEMTPDPEFHEENLSPPKKKSARRKKGADAVIAAVQPQEEEEEKSPVITRPAPVPEPLPPVPALALGTPAPPRKKSARRSHRKPVLFVENEAPSKTSSMEEDSLFAPDEEIILMRPSSRNRSRTTSVEIERSEINAPPTEPVAATAVTEPPVVSPCPAPIVEAIGFAGIASKKSKASKQAHSFPVTSFYSQSAGPASVSPPAIQSSQESTSSLMETGEAAQESKESKRGSGKQKKAAEKVTVEQSEDEKEVVVTTKKTTKRGAAAKTAEHLDSTEDLQETVHEDHELRHTKRTPKPSSAAAKAEHEPERRSGKRGAKVSAHTTVDEEVDAHEFAAKHGMRGPFKTIPEPEHVEELEFVAATEPVKRKGGKKGATTKRTMEVIEASDDEAQTSSQAPAPKKRASRPSKKVVAVEAEEEDSDTVDVSETKTATSKVSRSGRKAVQKLGFVEELEDSEPIVLKSSRKSAKVGVMEYVEVGEPVEKKGKRGSKSKTVALAAAAEMDVDEVVGEVVYMEDKKGGRSSRSKRS
ncbi:UNVERIFIED_CONTAM: antigen identified by monoclonal antibody Ki-67 [Siphonaria sp. JEL0065]|nr:antigen identified by monoclonal antibody Ki-67 [Siphonaria sp. JEL0065]